MTSAPCLVHSKRLSLELKKKVNKDGANERRASMKEKRETRIFNDDDQVEKEKLNQDPKLF